ncbi:MAG: PilZ domain-containing protein [Acidobacteriota bacterium]|nr:PilZ domain-containing protein [Acidobacteriota bacterium]
MEHRRESRLKISKNVILKVGSLLGVPDAAKPIFGVVLDMSGSGVRLELSLPVPVGAEVEIADNHTLILGEILRCEPEGEGYIAAVRVSEVTTVEDAPAPRARG